MECDQCEKSNVLCCLKTIWLVAHNCFLFRIQHTTAVASGFRNSGISIGGKGKIIVVRKEW